MKKYEIYQLDWSIGESIIRDFAYRSYERMAQSGVKIKKELYALVYTLESEAALSLDDLYYMFNMEMPDDFGGHSLSVSDVVKNDDGYWYCDSFGWKKLDWE